MAPSIAAASYRSWGIVCSPASSEMAKKGVVPYLDPTDDVHGTTRRALELVQNWLADERFAETRLLVLTRRAVPVHPGETALSTCVECSSPRTTKSISSRRVGRWNS